MHLSMASQQGGGGGTWGIGWGFDIFQKNAVKFPTPGKKCEVKYNENSPPHQLDIDRYIIIALDDLLTYLMAEQAVL